jgi:hypothetical protein
VPCVLLSFEFEHILMWRGRDWKSSLIESNGDDHVTSSRADNSLSGNIENTSDLCPDAISSDVDEVVNGNMPMESPVESAEVAQSLSGIIFDIDSVCISYIK